ncbi:VOC family protein [Paraburkholderia diazotrophica]|uniref:Catechol 2,3-dioxygenase n=1 Tax=Paraburkholderia diazotrophica TaxID=667676 RepID=A0A1H6XEQ9_9BURK|nr:VOC family protein [Paraburkholderia diazotrophica]SEJ23370.1 Catechol 2,3-dioxygenase [Paraburkholderia diazotrophica]
MHLDHATIVTPDLDATRQFFVDVVGLTQGARPPFGVGGYWLYAGGRTAEGRPADGRPVIHLVDSALPHHSRRTSPRIDHIAFRLDGDDEWQALLARLEAAGVAYQTADVPLAGEVQLFVALAPGVVIEFVTAARNVRRASF